MTDSRPHSQARTRSLSLLKVRPRLGAPSNGWLFAGSLALPCQLGPAGLTRRKREGDGATPAGRFDLLHGFFRPDRGPRPAARLPCRPLRSDDGWCDDPRAVGYNRPVRLPSPAGHEAMWRADRLYDVVLVIDYNVRRPRRGRGSAIFLHVMAPDGRPTAGCVAVRPADLRRLLPRLDRRCRIAIG